MQGEADLQQHTEAVFFDLDDTLYDQLEPFRNAVEAESETAGQGSDFHERAFRRVRQYSDKLWADYSSGALPLEELRRLRTAAPKRIIARTG